MAAINNNDEVKIPTKKKIDNDKKLKKNTLTDDKKEHIITKKNDKRGKGAVFEEDLSTTGNKLPNMSRITHPNRSTDI